LLSVPLDAARETSSVLTAPLPYGLSIAHGVLPQSHCLSLT